MEIKKQDGPPKDLLYFDDEVNLTPLQVEDVVEIFNTPLTGSYNWDYTVADNRIKKLYELGKELNWNGSIDLKWDYTHPADQKIIEPDEGFSKPDISIKRLVFPEPLSPIKATLSF